MKKRTIAILFVILGGSLGGTFLPQLWLLLGIDFTFYGSVIVNILLGALIFLLLSYILMNTMMTIITRLEKKLSQLSASYIISGLLGLVAGLIAAWLIGIPINGLEIPVLSQVLPLILSVLLGYMGFYVATTRIEDFRKLITTSLTKKKKESSVLERKADDYFRRYKILDTSVIIDGRIYDIVQTGFIEGTIVIPSFVLHELQLIADSADSIKRVRGRRGLDILNALQKDSKIPIESYDGDYDDIQEVDSKLIRLAKAIDGIVVTNDYNLNKVCEFQNVPVFNINALANSIKPVVIPGETMKILVIKQGTERNQGVAYLDDGTMVVVEDGQFHINEEIEVIVTSALQTAAGRMIFAKPAYAQRKIHN